MISFKSFLIETKFPGGYYDAYGNLKVRFNNAKEKEEWDSDSHNEKISDDWHYECDKETKSKATVAKIQLKTDKIVKSISSNISDNANKIASHIITQSFGDSLVSQQSVDAISGLSNITKEIGLSKERIKKLEDLISKYKSNEEVKKILNKYKINEKLRLEDLQKKSKRYQEEYYN